MINFSSSFQCNQDAAVIFLTQEQIKNKASHLKYSELKEQLQALSKTNRFIGDSGQIFPLNIDGRLILLVGVGAQKDLSLTQLRITARKAFLSAYLTDVKSIEILPSDQTNKTVIAIIEGIDIGTYSWDKYKSDQQEKTPFAEKDITLVVQQKEALTDAVTICGGVNLARDLVNENADVANSELLEKVIRWVVRGQKKVSLEILKEKEMREKGLGLHLAVNKGSINEPKLIIVKYQGGKKNDKYTAFIGKGMTFDTGGLNLKPTGNIETMKLDMGGAAAVIGTLKNAVTLNLKKNILFVCGVAENVTGSAAYKPGDVLTGYAGKTVEVANTDAEGRLVLADAISYVVKNYKPKTIIDIATLTGACVVGLGLDYTGLVTTSDTLAKNLTHSSVMTDDRAWRLPIYPELKDSVKSQIADICNLGSPKGAGGAITAAEFLRQFTEDTQWAHLDIAGTSFVDGAERLYFAHGATGSGVRLMTHFFQHH